ncbi:hypothetical protein [Planotetraspora mira]|jgi:hypothetical protein|uniref:Uncharacterized protein n=1 Tax=Planotetraspora mira TaxID=58121 RepID=A0A8J3XFQ1_9ACTN|nr:hypothetical protein [Planotetraspora mira]GII34728.1 hypothetical protein Pmi06nite_81700 [Planotetraspora mira]
MPVSYLIAMFHDRIHRARTAPTKGASAVEWVIITAIVAGLAITISLVITAGVTAKNTEIQKSFGGAK